MRHVTKKMVALLCAGSAATLFAACDDSDDEPDARIPTVFDAGDGGGGIASGFDAAPATAVGSVSVHEIEFANPALKAATGSGVQISISIEDSSKVVAPVVGNGAPGTSHTLVPSEVWAVGCGIALSPTGLIDRSLAKSLGLSLLAGAAMVGVAYATKPISLFLAVPLAVATYGVVAWFSGAVQPSTVDMLKGMLGRKLARFRS